MSSVQSNAPHRSAPDGATLVVHVCDRPAYHPPKSTPKMPSTARSARVIA